ncbi:DNA polymerase III subunit alpha [Waddlia chondrophila 2032/99]|uniref:DNA polymerase III subunit alpha n=2 Tax=Waddlia chondrophila TaxID=71667 RepID=D6YS27_WADCW|nr:DNA polymerase III subunit alpha [Waddlia chondrophila]ADI38872.1 DNA polymerase III, alpha subunit [Waddlia chondrophila WSU 86-1044]CCB90724.1 DNA polymerase III subunit alpha [Waddlia chondrophila 2032/99]
MFVPLHVHSQYSILDASASVKAIAAKAKEFGMPAVALTDHGNLFGAVDFYKSCKGNGVKPIIGCEVYIAPNSRLEKKKERGERAAFHQTLLAKNDEGYHNLCALSSRGFLEGFYYFPRIDMELLKERSRGLICLSGCMSSKLSQAILDGAGDECDRLADWYLEVFGEDFYIELQRHPMSEASLHEGGMYQESWLIQQYQGYIEKQNRLNDALLEIAERKGILYVATNDSHYIERSDWQAHEVLLNVQSGEPVEIWEKDSLGNPKFRVPNPKRRTYSSHEFYFKSPDEMGELFKDLPEALSNTLAIADKCTMELDFETKHYPVYVPPSIENTEYTDAERVESVEKFLRQLCAEGIPKRYTPERLEKVKEVYPDRDPLEVVHERLEEEMSVIAPKGMCDYLLIVWDFINWAKNHGIPVGPGRGSGAGSIVLYLIGITDIEPLRFNLFFERFINPERLSYPDIDVDICMDRRGDVIQYTLDKYGKDNVAQIITFGTMKAKMVLRDVGRVLSVPLAKVNEIAKLVPDDLNITLETALEKDHDLRQLYEQDEETRRLVDLGKKLEGSIRNTGIHAAGIIICGDPLVNHIPVCVAKDAEMPATQYSMKPAEQVGMLKVDFLGLKTLTAIQTCVNAIKERVGEQIDWVNLPLDNEKAFNLLNQGKTLGVFQLESGGMQDLARQLHLDKFEEIIAVSALYRPGPMDMIPSFINRKHGREEIDYDHPWMKEILAETYGIMVYQEQVMQIAQKLANYSLGEGDVLRRAMGKKDAEQMAAQREKFRLGALENGISENVSMNIFDKMEKFAAYGFNKSHAAAYSYIAYVTAFLKANYPEEWMAALMTCDRHDLTKLSKFIRECQAMQIKMLPPDVNEAGTTFMASKEGIRFAMSGIKGVGTSVVEAIVAEREKGGRFESLYQFIKRIDSSKVGKKVIENLVEAGCFDFTGWSRDQLRMSVEPMFESAMKEKKEEKAGVRSLFELMGENNENLFAEPPKVNMPTPSRQIYLKEKELLGFFLTGHPMNSFKDILERLSCIALRNVETLDHQTVFRSAFLVETVRTLFSSKSQRKFAILMVSDGIESFELPIWPEMYEEKHQLIKENQLLYAVLEVDRSEGSLRLSCRWFDDLTQANEATVKECDQAFDRAKFMAARASHSKNRRSRSNQKKKEEPKVEIEKVSLKLDADKTRLSHILEIKKLFESSRGKNPVQIDFMVDGRSLAALHIDQPWGVEWTPELKEKLEKFSWR